MSYVEMILEICVSKFQQCKSVVGQDFINNNFISILDICVCPGNGSTSINENKTFKFRASEAFYFFSKYGLNMFTLKKSVYEESYSTLKLSNNTNIL